MNVELIRNRSTDEYDTVQWECSGGGVRLSFPFEVNAIYASKISRVIVEKYEQGKVGFYQLDGALEFDSEIPKIEGYRFRGINKNSESKTGVSLLFYPSDPGKGNQWRDIEQYELVADLKCLGRYLNIYR